MGRHAAAYTHATPTNVEIANVRTDDMFLSGRNQQHMIDAIEAERMPTSVWIPLTYIAAFDKSTGGVRSSPFEKEGYDWSDIRLRMCCSCLSHSPYLACKDTGDGTHAHRL